VNPVSTLLATTRLPRVAPPDDPAYLTPEQLRELADEIGPKYSPLVMTAAYTGLRAGELAALRVKDVDLKERRLKVRESISDVDGTLHYVKPKSGKARTLALPKAIADMLGPLVRDSGKDEFVFGTDKPLRHRNFYARQFKPAVARLVDSERWPEHLAKLRFHDLRHTAAAILIKNGEHPKAVQERLGHSSITVTMDRYGKLYEGHDKELVKRLDRTIRAAS
jgi:integrase